MKFKVGEKVRIREDLEADKEYGCLISNSEMVKLKGQIFEIEAITCDDDKLIWLKDENRFNWTEFMLEPVEEKNCDTCKHDNTYFDCSQRNDFDEWEKAEETEDLVNHPKHYTQGKYEVIDIIMEAVKDLPPEQAVCVGHIIRYIMRYKYKNGLQDVKKCKWYTDKLINLMEGN
jgi:hypothetical protein